MTDMTDTTDTASPLTNLSIDQLIDRLSPTNTDNIWCQSVIDQFNKNINKNTVCGKTNAMVNTYIANPDDPTLQYLGEQLIFRYSLADEYLVKLQSAISSAIEVNRVKIDCEKTKIEKIINQRADVEKVLSRKHQVIHIESEVLRRINLLPEDIVSYIKDYLPPHIILASIRIPENDLACIMNTLKMKNIKGIHNYMKRGIYTFGHIIERLSYSDSIRKTDTAVLCSPMPGTKKKDFIVRIGEIVYAYQIVWNIVSKIKGNPPYTRTKELCIKLTEKLEKHMTYLYKLINFAARPEMNARYKPKPSVATT